MNRWTGAACVLLLMGISPSQGAVSDDRPYCNLGVFTPAERSRHLALIGALKAGVLETAELTDGLGFRFAPPMLPQLTEWSELESKCCPFITFQFALAPQPGGELWMRLTGRPVVKEFIRTEFEPLKPRNTR
jgi:hypothetical protein